MVYFKEVCDRILTDFINFFESHTEFANNLCHFYCCTVHVVTIISFILTHEHFYTL